MARIRYLKQDFFQDEDLCALSSWHRLCYAGLWTEADRAGRMEDRPKRLKARIFPYDELDMEALLTGLARAGFIVRYLVDGRAYLAIKEHAWARHQRPRNDESESTIPPPSDHALIYASLGDNEALAVSLRQTQPTQEVTETVTDPSRRSDGAVSMERIGIGIGNRNGSSSAEALTRSTPPRNPTQESSEARARDESPVVLTFPTVGPLGHSWALREAQIAEWVRLFPGLDVRAETRKALAWVTAHQDRRKTVRGMPKFLVGWLTRAVDGGRGRHQAAPAPAEPSRRSVMNADETRDYLRRMKESVS